MNAREIAEAQLGDMQKRLDQERFEREAIVKQISDIVSRKSILANQM